MKKRILKKRHKAALGVLLFIVLILFAVPRVAKWYIVKHSPDIIGRHIDIDKIRLNYFTGTLRINDLKLYESDAKTVFASFSRFKVNLDYFPLFRNEIYVRYVSVENPFAQILQNGSRFNFSDLTESQDSTVAEPDTATTAPMKYIINNIRIAGGYLKYTDQVLDHTIAMKNLDLNIPGFTWNSDSTNLNVDFRFVDGGRFYSKFALNQADSTYAINLKLDSLNLGIIEPYAKSSLYVSALHGWLSNDIQIKGNMNSVAQLFVKGVNHIYGFQLTDTLNRTVFSFNDLTIDIDSIELAKNRFDINYVGLTDPFILFELVDTTNNLLALIKPSTPEQADTLAAPADTTVSSTPISYTFPKINLSGGKVSIADKTMRYPFAYTIDNLKVDCFEAPKNPGKLVLKLSAGLNGTGTIVADALVNPENTEEMNIKLEIGQFRMKDMEPYFMHYLGYPVLGGIMNFTTDNQMKPKSLISNNNLYFRKFTLSERTDKNCEYKIPVRLALGVLSDKDGIIDLKAPIESKGDEVKIRNLGRIIFRILGNLFVKAAVSPFNALAGSYSVDPAELQEIKLNLTAPAPDEANLKSVDIIADILSKKPGLNADFYYCIDRDNAADSLAYLLSVQDYIDFNRNKGINIRNVADSTLLKYLLEKPSSAALRENPVIDDLCRAYIGGAKLNSSLDSLRTLQTSFLSNYLGRDKALPPGRFRVIENAPDTIKPPSNYPVFRIYFTAGE